MSLSVGRISCLFPFQRCSFFTLLFSIMTDVKEDGETETRVTAIGLITQMDEASNELETAYSFFPLHSDVMDRFLRFRTLMSYLSPMPDSVRTIENKTAPILARRAAALSMCQAAIILDVVPSQSVESFLHLPKRLKDKKRLETIRKNRNLVLNHWETLHTLEDWKSFIPEGRLPELRAWALDLVKDEERPAKRSQSSRKRKTNIHPKGEERKRKAAKDK